MEQETIIHEIDKDILVIDDVLPEWLWKTLYQEICHSQTSSIDWKLRDNVATFNETVDGNVHFTNIPYCSFEGGILNDLYHITRLPLICGLSKINLYAKELLRIKINLTMRDNNATQTITPHTDWVAMDHWTALYYINDSDGETYFYNKKQKSDPYDPDFDESNEEYKAYYRKTVTELSENVENNLMVKIAPRKNRMVVFNGDYFHSGSNPVESQRRFAINYNFVI